MQAYDLTNPYEIAKFIKNANKTTPMKAYIQVNATLTSDTVKLFGDYPFYTAFGESDDIKNLLASNADKILFYELENDRRLSAIPLLDLTSVNARIEPGALIRDRVEIEDQAVIMMGAVINIGAHIGKASMIDMNAVLGARAYVGEYCHIGAGTVLAGVLEPPSATPVIIEDHVLIGANCVVLEGVRVGEGAVVAAGSVVTKDVPSGTVVAGTPAKVIKTKDEQTIEKTQLLDDLR
ncbi:2,3,4,5-tetrahydropyridine-2,6-dicarboxylate N-acetyltransferase [Fusibacter bizertensis]